MSLIYIVLSPHSKQYATFSKFNETHMGYQYIVFSPKSRNKFGIPPCLWLPEDKNENIILQYFTSNQLLFLPHTWSSNEVKEISSM